MSEEAIGFAASRGYGEITIDRPAKRNALTEDMRRRLDEVVTSAEFNECSVVLVRAEGGHFSAGADLNEPDADTTAGQHLLSSLRKARPVLVCAAGGYTLGYAAALALACDLLVAGDDVRLGFPEVHLGIVPRELAEAVLGVLGAARTKSMMLTGQLLGAAELRAAGIATETAPAADLNGRAQALCRSLLEIPANTLLAAKDLFAHRQ